MFWCRCLNNRKRDKDISKPGFVVQMNEEEIHLNPITDFYTPFKGFLNRFFIVE